MQHANRPYGIDIKFLYSPDLNQLQAELPSLNRFSGIKPLRFGGHIILEHPTLGGISSVTLTPYYVTFRYPEGPIELDNLTNSFRESIETAKYLESVRINERNLGFNPNLMTLRLGIFDSEGSFLASVSEIALDLQRKLYLGGSPLYYKASEDFILFLGLEAEFSKKQKLLDIKKIESEGIAQPADSLDELLQRLGQKPQ